MITIIYSTHKDKEYNDKFNEHLVTTSGLNNIQILFYENHNQHSLASVYNSGITESIYDIVVCCHNDIKLENNWGKKLLSDFSNNPEFGIIGKAGSCYFPESGVYWEKMQHTMVGQVYHFPPGHKKFLSKYSPKLPFLIPVVTVDGLFISFDKTKINHRFDESYGKFHFYDHGFAVPNYLDGVKIGVTSSFEITHESVGQPNQEFWESKEKFLEKWANKLPLDLKPEKIHIPEIKRKTFKKFGKVAIIIPTKGKIDMLMDCINSFYEHCDSNVFDIFIADTGSENEEKIELKNRIEKFNNVFLLEYDYYNFAKINNDVVKNHISEKYEFLVFSNNDIKILNDIISGMLNIFNDNRHVGTVGVRLHYQDNTVQHDGIFMGLNKNNMTIGVSHLNLNNYYNYYNSPTTVFGNTAGLLMIRKNTFEQCGMFNENYISCFEDVELNIKTLSMRLVNYVCSNCVAYHYESATRNEDPENLQKLQMDYSNNLIPIVREKWELIKDKVLLLQ
jgi:GT2 family glycosyltransferase